MEPSCALSSAVKTGLAWDMRCASVIRRAEDLLSRNGSADLSENAGCAQRCPGDRTLREEAVSGGASGGAAGPVARLTMDNGLRSPAPVRNKLRRQRRSNWSDLSHVQRRLGESLWYLARTYKELTPEVLLWFQSRCFSYCVLQYQGDATGLKRALLSFVDHAYGKHENCGAWCRGSREPQAHRPGHARPSLADPHLRYKLDTIFRQLSEKSEELARGGSLADTKHTSGMMEFSFTLPSDEENGLGRDKFAGASRMAEEVTTRNELAGPSESAKCEKVGTGVISEVEEDTTRHDLADPSESAECEKRGTGVISEVEEDTTRNELADPSESAEHETRGTGVINEVEQHVAGNDLTGLLESAECERRCTGVSSEEEEEEEEHVARNDLTGLSERAAASGDFLKMDDDITAPAPVRMALRKKSRSSWSDLCQLRTCLGESLVSLAKAYKELTPQVLLWFQTSCLKHAICRYRGDAAGLKRALLSFVDHAYGEHENCGAWCAYNGDPHTYRPRTFEPSLSDPSLKLKLSTILGRLVEKSGKIAGRSSMKAMQSPCNVLLGKVFKTKCLGSPQPLRNQLKTAGYAHLFPESTSHRLSPARVTRLHSSTKEVARKPEKDQMGTNEKHKRKPLREKQKVAPWLSPEVGGDSPPGSETPALMVRPPMEHVLVEQPMTLVFFDLETTSLAKDCEIIQLAASCGRRTFDRYILPVRRITPGASRVTGLTVSKGVLWLHHRALKVVPIREALLEFVDWLKGVGRCLLVGHNSKTFDAPRLLLQLEKNGLAKTFCHTVLGFLDTLPYFRESRPHLDNHTQETLARELLKVKYNAHRALDDVKILQRLVEQFADHAALAKHGFSATWVYETMKYELRKQENLATFAKLERKAILSKGLCEKMAGSGLRESHLRVAHARAASRGELGREGIKRLLTERDAEGKIRVTNQVKVLDRIAAFYDGEMISAW